VWESFNAGDRRLIEAVAAVVVFTDIQEPTGWDVAERSRTARADVAAGFEDVAPSAS
jgi:hypothetical protein